MILRSIQHTRFQQRTLALGFLIVLCGLSASSGWIESASARNPGEERSRELGALFDKVAIQESPRAKIYWARVILEDYKKWPVAYELLREVVRHHQHELDSVAYDKVKKAMKEVGSYLPNRWFRRAVNGRHLIRPFLEAQYLLNEALMDTRIAINTSSDSEILFIEQLLQSYFFPGFESLGKISYPEAQTYAFDFYALTEENLLRARREASDLPEPSAEDDFKRSDRSDRVSGRVNGPVRGNPGGSVTPSDRSDSDWSPVARRDIGQRSNGGSLSRLSLINGLEQDSPEVSPVKSLGFIDVILASDLDNASEVLQRVSEKVSELMKKYKRTRVPNRYLPQALLFQAITDPGSVLLDPQMQDFLKGVRLELKLADLDEMPTDLSDFEKYFLPGFIEKTPQGYRFVLKKLLEENRQGAVTQLDLELRQSPQSGKTALYLLSGAGIGELMIGRIILGSVLSTATYLQHQNAIHGAIAAVKGSRITMAMNLQTLALALQKTVQVLNQMKQWGFATKGAAKLIGYSMGSVAFLGVQAIELHAILSKWAKASPTVNNAVTFFKTHKGTQTVKQWGQKGYLLRALVGLSVVVDLSIMTMEMKAFQNDEYLRRQAYEGGLSRAGASLTYLLPVVGWVTACVDVFHMVGVSRYQTADAFTGTARLGEDIALMIYGAYHGQRDLNRVSLQIMEWEGQFALPRSETFYRQYPVRLARAQETREEALFGLLNEFQSTTLGYALIVSRSHAGFAASTNNRYGRYLEKLSGDYAQSSQYFRKALEQILTTPSVGDFEEIGEVGL